MRKRVAVPALVASSWLVLAGFVRPASAQTSGGKWEIEFHAGGMLVGNSTAGSSVALPGTEPFTTGTGAVGVPSFPSRRVSSWYFGDGATLLNDAAGISNRPFRIVPLDPILSGSLSRRRHGGGVGVRVSRRLNARLAAEFSLDYSLARLELTGDRLRAIEASRVSFLAAWYQFLGPLAGPFSPQPRVTSTADIQPGNARQLISTGALNIHLKTSGNLIPYVTAGAGVVSRVGNAPSVTVAGDYQFMFVTPFNAYPLNESDIVTVREARPGRSFVGLIGGGARLQTSPRWGVRFDARALLGRNKVGTVLDANPSVTPGTPSLLLWTGTTPSIQFANQDVRRSTLSGPRLESVETFKGSGAHRQLSVTTGVYWRF